MNENITYYRLLDPQHKGMIVRDRDGDQHRFDPVKGWIHTGILLQYEWPESDFYGRYEEIPEEQALQLTK